MFVLNTQRLKVNNYSFPENDNDGNFALLTTDGEGQLQFAPIMSSSGTITVDGSGVSGRVAGWASESEVTSTPIVVDASSSLFAVGNITTSGAATFGGIRYPTTITTSGTTFSMITNGSGVVRLVAGLPPQSLVDGSGAVNTLTHWTSGTEIGSVGGATYSDAGTWGTVTSIECNGSINIENDVSGGFGSVSVLSSVDCSHSAGVSYYAVSSESCQATGGNITGVICSISANMEGSPYTNGPFCSELYYGADLGFGPIAIIADSNVRIVDSADSMVVACTDISHAISSYFDESYICGVKNARINYRVLKQHMLASKNINYNQNQTTTQCLQPGAIASSDLQTNMDFRSAGTSSIPPYFIACQSGTMNSSYTLSLPAGTMSNIGEVACSSVNISGLYQNVCCLASSDLTLDGTFSRGVIGGKNSTRNWTIESDTGTFYGQVLTIQNPVPDFAEYFENDVSGTAISAGYFVSLTSNGKVKLASSSDTYDPIGIVSSSPGLTAGGADLEYHAKYLVDEWGRPQMELDISSGEMVQAVNPEYLGHVKKYIPNPEYIELTDDMKLRYIIDDSGNIVENPKYIRLTEKQRLQYIQNPDYIASPEYIPRSERTAEWTCVGLIGQLRLIVDDTVGDGDFIKCSNDGTGTKQEGTTSVQCMGIIQESGPRIALVLLK